MIKFRSTLAGLLISTVAVAFGGSARAEFVGIATSSWQTSSTSLNIDVANSGQTSYTGHVGNVVGTNVINITTTTATDTGAGNAIITPTGTGKNQDIFSSVTFSPVGNNYTSFSTQGSLPDTGDVTITVFDNFNQAFTFTEQHNANWVPAIGVEALAGSNEFITSVTVSTDNPNGFVSVKQVDFGFATAVPEASTWAMMLFGFMGVGLLAYRRRGQDQLRLA
jgi:hypothetical protein